MNLLPTGSRYMETSFSFSEIRTLYSSTLGQAIPSAFGHYDSAETPDFFLIPSEAWKVPNEVFVDRNYDKPGQSSKPEYGINISNKNYDILEFFKFEESIKDFLMAPPETEGT